MYAIMNPLVSAAAFGSLKLMVSELGDSSQLLQMIDFLIEVLLPSSIRV
jgi:hypothetical protein